MFDTSKNMKLRVRYTVVVCICCMFQITIVVWFVPRFAFESVLPIRLSEQKVFSVVCFSGTLPQSECSK